MQIDPCEGDLSDERMLDHTYSGVEEDTFQVSMIALHGSACSTDLDYLQSSTPKVGTCFGFGGSFFDVYATFFTEILGRTFSKWDMLLNLIYRH